MNDEQLVEYCRKLIKSNLNQYVDDNPGIILNEIYKLDNDKTNNELLEHCKGVKELLEKCIEILEENQNASKKS